MQPAIRRRMARAGGRDDLDEATAARLAVFAGLHDIGKVNIGFQTRIWTDADLPAGQRRPGEGGAYRRPYAGVRLERLADGGMVHAESGL